MRMCASQVEKQKPKSFKNLSVNLQNVLQSNPGIDGHTSVNSDNVFKPRRPSVGYPSRTRAPASSTWRRWWDATCIAFETSVLPTDREPASSLPAASSRQAPDVCTTSCLCAVRDLESLLVVSSANSHDLRLLYLDLGGFRLQEFGPGGVG